MNNSKPEDCYGLANDFEMLKVRYKKLNDTATYQECQIAKIEAERDELKADFDKVYWLSEETQKAYAEIKASHAELVEALDIMCTEFRHHTTDKMFQAPPFLKQAEALLSEALEVNEDEC